MPSLLFTIGINSVYRDQRSGIIERQEGNKNTIQWNRECPSCTNLLFLPSFLGQSDDGITFLWILGFSCVLFFSWLPAPASLPLILLNQPLVLLFSPFSQQPRANQPRPKKKERMVSLWEKEVEEEETGRHENKVFVHGNRLAEIRSVCCSWLAGFHMLDTLFFSPLIPFPTPILPHPLPPPFVLDPIINRLLFTLYPHSCDAALVWAMSILALSSCYLFCLSTLDFAPQQMNWREWPSSFTPVNALTQEQKGPIADHHDQLSDYSLGNKLSWSIGNDNAMLALAGQEEERI